MDVGLWGRILQHAIHFSARGFETKRGAMAPLFNPEIAGRLHRDLHEVGNPVGLPALFVVVGA